MGALQTQNSGQVVNVKSLLSNVGYKKRFEEMLGKKAPGFISSIVNLTNSDVNLSKCEPNSVIACAVVAATLDLPVDKNLGFTWIIPYGNKAQFQLGYKGYIQLALRSGQYKRINVVEVYANQYKSYNKLTEELEADFSKVGEGDVKGFAAYFQLINGFEKTTFWFVEDVMAHAKRFSKTFHKGPWQTDFNAMAKKTVLKNTLATFGILSIEMQRAIQTDQAVINSEINDDGEIVKENIEYVDASYESKEVGDISAQQDAFASAYGPTSDENQDIDQRLAEEEGENE